MKINREDLDKKNISYEKIAEKEYIIVYKYNDKLYQIIRKKFSTAYEALNYIDVFSDKLINYAYNIITNENKKNKSKDNKKQKRTTNKNKK